METAGGIYVFTDGACLNNGAENARASYGVVVKNMNSEIIHTECAKIVGQQTNNRGELTGILRGLKFINAHMVASEQPYIYYVVSDSTYSINCVESWYATWIADPKKLKDKKNLDIIAECHALAAVIRQDRQLVFKHVNSHTPMPSGGEELFLWDGNNRVDLLCNEALK